MDEKVTRMDIFDPNKIISKSLYKIPDKGPIRQEKCANFWQDWMTSIGVKTITKKLMIWGSFSQPPFNFLRILSALKISDLAVYFIFY